MKGCLFKRWKKFFKDSVILLTPPSKFLGRIKAFQMHFKINLIIIWVSGYSFSYSYDY